jgi:NaMN:DMB phosphoribosyltransferase
MMKNKPTQGLRLVKKFHSATPAEEVNMQAALEAGQVAISIIVAYLEAQVQWIDAKLSNTDALYSKPGADLAVAVLLARREVQLKLRNLLLDKIELDADHAED